MISKKCSRVNHDENCTISFFHGHVCNVCHAKEARERRKKSKKIFKTAEEWFECVAHNFSNKGTIGFCRNPRASEFESMSEFNKATILSKNRYKEYRKDKRKNQKTEEIVQEESKIETSAPTLCLKTKRVKKLSSQKIKYESANQWYENVVNKTSTDDKTIGNCRRPQCHEFTNSIEFEHAKQIRHDHQLKYRAARRTFKKEKESSDEDKEKHKSENDSPQRSHNNKRKLTDSFVVMPFSLLEASSSAWQLRKKYWNSMFDSLKGRSQNLLNMSESCRTKWSGTSRFDPVLCEVVYSWFCPRSQLITNRPIIILDPFAGGCVRGIVASKMGLQYIGVDTNKKQIDENISNYNLIKEKGKYPPIWVHGDSQNIETYFREILLQLDLPETTQADLIFTCPPYYNLEIYTDDKNDLSNLPTYKDFLIKYEIILEKCSFLLSDHHLCVFVVSNFRNKNGEQIPFHIDTQSILLKKLKLHQDIILSREKAQAAFRARMITSAGSKLANTHQNICIFSKNTFTPKEARLFGIRASEEEVTENLKYKNDQSN